MRKRLLIAVAVVVALCAIAAAVAWFSPLLQAKNVEVTGNARTSVEEIQAAADIPQDAKLVPLSSKDVATRVAQLPWIAKVSVHKRVPDTVSIEVVEHQAVGFVEKQDGKHIFDESGQVFMIAEDPAGATKVVAKNDEGNEAAASVLGAIAPEFRVHVVEIEANNPNAITLKLDDGRRVYWGSTDNMHNKSVAMKAALSRGEQYIDISAAPDIAVR